MPPKKKDDFAQRMYLEVSLTDTAITFSRVNVGLSIFDYAAFIIHRTEWDWPRKVYDEMTDDAADEVQLALTGSNSIAAISAAAAQVYDLIRLRVYVNGTPASANLELGPIIHDFTGLPGGGLIVPAQDLFFAGDVDGFSLAATYSCAVYYTIKAISAADYLELAQSYRVISSS